MKHTWLLTLILALFLTILSPTVVSASYEGSCGKDARWEFTAEDATLRISGSGTIYDIKNGEPTPWHENSDQIRHVVVDKGITHIGAYAFMNLNLRTVTLPSTLKSIGAGAFMHCTLESIDIPDSVTEIYDYAFSGCTSLTTVELPEKLRDLYSNAFQGCTALSSLSPLPEKLQMIGNYVFESTAIREIVIPERVGMLGGAIFKGCSQLERVVIKSPYPTIESNMFRGCSSLKMVYFPETVQLIRSQAFADCSSLESIYFLGNMPAFEQQTDHNSYGFAGTVYYSEDNPYWSSGSIQNLQSHLRGSELNFIGTSVHYCMDKHNEIIYAAVPPTCLETGLTEGRYCFVCENTLVMQETVPATGHTFGDWQEVEAATTEKDGLAERACEVCGLIEYKILDKLVPPPTEPTVAPTQPTVESVPPTVAPTQPTVESVPPTQASTEAVQPDITVTEEPNSFPWAIVVIAVASVAAAAAGFLIAKKKK